MTARNPLLLPALGCVAGICAAEWWGVGRAEGLMLAAVAAGGALVCRWRSLRVVGAICLVTLFGGLGMFRLSSAPPLDAPRLNVAFGERAILQGCVVEPAVADADRMRFVLEISTGARVRVSAERGPWMPAYGDRAEGVAKVLEPSEFRNPGAFSYRSWLARRSIFWVASSSKDDRWQRTGSGCGAAWRAWVHRTRGVLLVRLDRIYGADRYHAAMMRGLLLGDATAIEKVWVEDFRRTGTYHALVISGGHVAFFTGLFLIWIRLSRWNWHGVMLVAIGCAWLYALLAGGQAPVVRSAAGFSFYVVARFVYRRARLLNLLALVTLLFLAADPRQLFEASFQLSFLAVAAIAALAEPLIEHHLQPLRPATAQLAKPTPSPRILPDPRFASLLVQLQLLARTIALTAGIAEVTARRMLAAFLQVWSWAGSSLLVSGCVQLALALPMMLYFHRVSWTGLTANLLVTPAVTLAVPFGFAAIATGWAWCASVACWLLDGSRWLASVHAGWEFEFRVSDPPLWLSAALLGATALWAVAAAGPFPPAVRAGSLEVTAIDVGNGDSIFLGLPDRRAVVIDSGGLPSRPGLPARIDTGEDVVSPYLWSRGIRRLDVLALTHLDNDHSGGMEALLANFRPREFWIGSLPDNPRSARLLQAARNAGARVVRLYAGQSFERGGVRWQVVSSEEHDAVRENDSSLVLRATHGRQSVLLTGDLERAGELRVLERGVPPSTVLKVSHHGSRTGTSPAWIEAVRPALALISAGRQNNYGFPHETVLRTLDAHRVQTLRTDQLGAAGLRTDGRSWEPLSPGPGSGLRWSPFGAVD